MPETHLVRAAAALVASVAMSIVFVSPASADVVDPIPGDGFFLVGPDIAPGLYHSDGTASTWGV